MHIDLEKKNTHTHFNSVERYFKRTDTLLIKQKHLSLKKIFPDAFAEKEREREREKKEKQILFVRSRSIVARRFPTIHGITIHLLYKRM